MRSAVKVISAIIDRTHRRIGLAPNVSIPGASLSAGYATASASQPLIGQQILKAQARPDTASSNTQAEVVISRPSVGQYNTVPERANGNANGSKPDEFGVTRTVGNQESKSNGNSERIVAQTIGGTPGLSATIGSGAGRIAPQASETSAVARPRASSARAAMTERRLTVTNLNEAEAAEQAAAANASRAQANSGSAAPSATRRPAVPASQGASRTRWTTAEEEKRRLYETAVANVERVQGVPVPRPLSPVEVSFVIL